MLKIGSIIVVGMGGALGTILRLILSRHLPIVFFTHFPAPIFLINILGCFMMGAVVELMASYWDSKSLFREFITTGFLGGFTTFSAFSLEYALIVERGLSGWAIFYAIATLIGTILAFFTGIKFVKFSLSFLI